MNRRDVLKFFGLGATVIPVLDGMPIVEAPAQLVTVPEVKIVEPPAPLVTGAEAISQMFCAGDPVTMSVRFTSKDGVVDFEAKTFISKMDVQFVDVTAHGRGARKRQLGHYGPVEWELHGTILDAWKQK